jgi:hypothetical protein
VAGTGVGSAQAQPLRVIPERGQVGEDLAEAPGAQRGDVLQEDERGSYLAKAAGDGVPQATAGSFRHAGTGARVGQVLAGPAGGDQVNGRHRRPVQGGDIAEAVKPESSPRDDKRACDPAGS